MKAIGLKLADVLAILWHLLPKRARLMLLKGLFVLESRARKPKVHDQEKRSAAQWHVLDKSKTRVLR